jgi:hypothetical protein
LFHTHRGASLARWSGEHFVRRNGNMSEYIDRFCARAVPELNWLLTEPPFETPTGTDFGWYCREHAFCTVAVGSLLGLSMAIVRGDFLLRCNGYRLCSIGSGDDHAWCATADAPILDASMNLHFLRMSCPFGSLATPVRAAGRNGDFTIRFLPETTTSDDNIPNASLIGYIPRSSQPWSLPDLLSHPQDVLPENEAIDIACRVSLHAFGVVAGTRPSVVGRVDQPSGLQALRSEFPNPRKDLENMNK